MRDEKFDVSVVICTYSEQRWRDLVAAVESVQRQTIVPREIIVAVDNNHALFDRAQDEIAGIVVVENSQQRGSSGSRNSAIAIAGAELIAFLDDDAMAEPDWLEHLCRSCADPQALGTGGAVEPCWTGKRPAWFPEEFYWVIGCSYRGLVKLKGAVSNATYEGCACIRREVFETIGGYRNEMGRVENAPPMGGEGAEMCMRAKLRWPERYFLYEERARIHHRVPPGRASWRYFCARCLAEGRSKALVARYAKQAGAKERLSTERAYVYRTLPRGVARGLADACLRFDMGGLLRAGAIVAGLLLTTTGYVTSLLDTPGHRHRKDPQRNLRRAYHYSDDF